MKRQEAHAPRVVGRRAIEPVNEPVLDQSARLAGISVRLTLSVVVTVRGGAAYYLFKSWQQALSVDFAVFHLEQWHGSELTAAKLTEAECRARRQRVAGARGGPAE